MSLLAAKLGVPVTDVSRMAIWGNHSTTQYPNLFHCQVGGKSAYELVGDHEWVDGTFIPTVAKRGAAIIEPGASSAASAANAAIDHVRSWALGTPEGDWVSMAVRSDGSYGVPEGLISSFPCTCAGGEYQIVQGLDIDDYPRQDRRQRGRAGRRTGRRQGSTCSRAPGARCRLGDGEPAGQGHHVVHAPASARRR